MPVSRIDGVSAILNCLLIVLAFLALFQLDAFSAADADTIPPQAEVSTASQFDGPDDCASLSVLPADISDYIEIAQSCYLGEDSGLQSQDGDVLVMFQRLNEVRIRNGLPPLLWHDGAAEVARLHGSDMIVRNYFAHRTPEGLSNVDRMKRLDRDEVFGVSGENLALYGDGWPPTYSDLTLQIQLEKSPSHFEAMVNPEYTHVGLSIVRRNNTYVAVQVFLSSVGQLDEDWPAELSSGDAFLLPMQIGERNVGGWRLEADDGRVISKAYDLFVEVPESTEDHLNLIILGEESRNSFLLLNGPSADLE